MVGATDAPATPAVAADSGLSMTPTLSGAGGQAATQVNTPQANLPSKSDGESTAKTQDQEAKPEDTQNQERLKSIDAAQFKSEFQNFVSQSVGRTLPMFGYDLFRKAPNTFAPVDRIPVTPDYTIGPGDELLVHVWGQVESSQSVVVDRNGMINLPKVGQVSVVGVRYQNLQAHLKTAIGRMFKNFELDVSLGKLRSIQVFVVGQAASPGNYTVSSLSTLVNALFASGGPSAKGSMRHIQLKRSGKVLTEFDMYDLLLKGDKSKDVQLLSGDVIYIPTIGAMAAITGSVNTSAIFELKGNEALSDLLNLAGGFTNVASGQKVTLERIHERKTRKVAEFNLDQEGLAKPLQDGDLVTVAAISERFDNAVKLQGNVAAPMRYVWKEGMRITDLLSDKNAIITSAYWARQNSGALNNNYNKKQVNWDYAVLQRLDHEKLTTKQYAFNLGKAIKGDPVENMLLEPGDIVTTFSADEALPKTENEIVLKGSIFTPSNRRFVWRSGMHIKDIIPNAKELIDYYDYWLNAQDKTLSAGINWGYANIVRLQPSNLTRNMITFDLGKLLLQNDQSMNLELLPGDEITIFTNQDIQVPIANRNIYVRLEGEFAHPGLYQVRAGETLRQLVERVGGLSPEAYLLGSEFTREATRQVQQKRLDDMITKMEAEIQRAAVRRSAAALNKEDADIAKSDAQAQEALLAKMRQVKATGRIVLEIPEYAVELKNLPDLALEDGDRLYIASIPSTVSVMGIVYNQNAFIYKKGQTVTDYLDKAGGPTRDGDESEVYLIRADGLVFSKRQGGSLFGSGGFTGRKAMPGDTIVVPEKLERYNLTKDLKDWSQIFYQFAIGVASMKTIGVF
jgi:protein involved in polysaccharide export with SLBB domain